jgi:hypothetical protein
MVYIYIYIYIYIYMCVCVCVCVFCAFIGLDNKLYNMHGTHIKTDILLKIVNDWTVTPC